MKLWLIRLLSLLPEKAKDTWVIIPNPEWRGHFLAVRNPEGMSNHAHIKAQTVRTYRIAERYCDTFFFECGTSW